MSNFTSASGEASVSGPNPHPAKRKRNLPGNPDPDAEVIALSPNTLMATNRFVCEICGKGFQRDQNLQLHRRGHNLPWKLKQRSGKEARKKAYVCPEATCVHHEPSRALGDLTGIKKHFSRKHGEKKWRCDKCSKKYAVQSDWKAHSKVCGTREYRCDCGTMFSRRDSFITHRAFCDALAEENARAAISSAVPSSNQSDPHFAVPSWLAACNHPRLDLPSQSSTHSSTPAPPSTLDELTKKMEPPFAFPSWLSACDDVRADFPTATPQGNGSPHMSATALLQKAAQMGATMSRPSSSFGLGLSSPFHQHGGAINVHDLMVSSLPLAASGFDQGSSFDVNFEGLAKEGGNHDDLTRDFLGLSAFSHRDLINLAGLETCISTSSFEPQDKKPWHLD